MSIRRVAPFALITLTLAVLLAPVRPAVANTCWSETGTCSGDRMDFTVACSGSCGATYCKWTQCYDCEGGYLLGEDDDVQTTDEYLYDLEVSTCSLVTDKNLGRTPTKYHPRLKVPVNVATGNAAYQETDFRITTPGLPIVFTRTWNSQGSIDEDLGDSWIHSYGWYVDDYGNYGKVVVQGDGRTHYYNCEDSNESYEPCDGDGSEVPVYVPHPGTGAYLTLEENANDYILTFEHGQVEYYFDKSKDNRLRMMDHPNGYNIQITFDAGDSDIDKIRSRHDTTVFAEVDVTCDANHRITKIEDAESNDYDFTYSSGRLDTRALPDSIGTRYYYYGDQNDINGTTVDLDAGGDTDNLTWVKDERGKIVAVFSYDNSDRVDFAGTGVFSNQVLQYHEFDYDTPDTGTTTVKGPGIGGEQRSTEMTWESWFGIGAVTANSTVGCGSCGATAWWASRSYDINLNPLISTSQENITTVWEYNSDGLPTAMIEDFDGDDERLTEYTYNATWNKIYQVKTPSVYGSNQKTTTYYWNSTYGDLTNRTESGYDPDGNSITRSWVYYRDSMRRVWLVNGPRTDVYDYTYYYYWPSGNGDKSYRHRYTALRVDDSPLTYLVKDYHDDYDANGRVTQSRNANLITTKYTYNGAGWLTEKHTIIGSEESCSTTTTDICYSHTYRPNGLLDATTLPEGNLIDRDYDAANRMNRIKRYNSSGGALIDYVQYSYDRENNRTKTQYKTGGGTETWYKEFDHDLTNRLTTISLPDANGGAGTVDVDLTWDDDGNLLTRTDANDNTTDYDYDGLGRLADIDLPGIGDTADYTYTYDDTGLLGNIDDPNGLDNTYEYDDFGNVLSVQTPDSGTYEFTYSKAGKVTQRTHTGLDTVSYEYDNHNRLTKIDYPEGYTDITYAYDSSHWGSSGYGKGHLCTMTDASGTTYFKYDHVGRVIIEKWTRSGTSFLTTYWYDRNGNLDALQYPSSRDIDYKMQSADKDRHDEVEGDYGVSTTYDFATSIDYKPYGPIEDMTLGNSVEFDATFSKRYQPLDWDYHYRSGYYIDWHYDYDDNGNVDKINLPSSQDWDYTYDSINRLTKGEDSRAGGWGYREFEYDDAGNVEEKHYNSAQTNTTTYNYTANTNQLSSLSGYESNSFSYNGAGSMTTQGPARNDFDYVFDPDERLVRVKNQFNTTVVDYVYDGLNRRRLKIWPDEDWTVFFYDTSGRLLEEMKEVDSTWYVADHIWLEGRLLARVDGSTNSFGGTVTDSDVYWYHLDHLGTPRQMLDDSRTKVWEAEYTPYGETTITTSTITNNVRFPGQYWDNETQNNDSRRLSYNWHRYYGANIGSYLETDPATMIGADSYSYRYSRDNPVFYKDPTGLIPPNAPGDSYGTGTGQDYTWGLVSNCGGIFIKTWFSAASLYLELYDNAMDLANWDDHWRDETSRDLKEFIDNYSESCNCHDEYWNSGGGDNGNYDDPYGGDLGGLAGWGEGSDIEDCFDAKLDYQEVMDCLEQYQPLQ